MIELIEPKYKTANIIPHYRLVINYMIGDADGYTREVIEPISVDNPHLERLVTILNSLINTPGHFGIRFDRKHLTKSLNAKDITEDDFEFLMFMLNIEDADKHPSWTEEEKDYVYEINDGPFYFETEYSFVTFSGCELYYINAYGTKFETKIK